jgi:hypothetical protein
MFVTSSFCTLLDNSLSTLKLRRTGHRREVGGRLEVYKTQIRLF